MIKKNIPNAITCGNLICGCFAVVQAFNGNLVNAAYFVGIALVLDFLDGFTARLLKVSSPIGKDLDSLADMVTFGVVPGVVMFKMIFLSLPSFHLANMAVVLPVDNKDSLIPYCGFIITVFSCIRLAKFNNDTRQSESFIGLPTPANTMVICSFPLIFTTHIDFFERWTMQNPSLLTWAPDCLIILSCVLSFLLVAELPLFALKFKGFSWSDPQNRIRFVFLGIALLLLLTLQFVAIPLIILLYILVSIVNNIFLKKEV